jgi:transcriptional regulator with XRE-family HTH domain
VKFSEAFRETLFRFNIRGDELAARSGVTATQISKFRNGGNLRIDSVEKLLDALPDEARDYLLLLVATKREAGHVLPLPAAIKNPLPANETEDEER